MEKMKNKKTDNTLRPIVYIIITCVLINILGTKLNALLGLPLYLDNTGTVLAALLGGYIPCITVGFFQI